MGLQVIELLQTDVQLGHIVRAEQITLVNIAQVFLNPNSSRSLVQVTVTLTVIELGNVGVTIWSNYRTILI